MSEEELQRLQHSIMDSEEKLDADLFIIPEVRSQLISMLFYYKAEVNKELLKLGRDDEVYLDYRGRVIT